MVMSVGTVINSEYKPESPYVAKHMGVFTDSNCSQVFLLEDVVMRKIDLAGKRFGKLTVLEEYGRDKSGQILWRCLCDCGQYTTVLRGNLRSGITKSCGCFAREQAKIAHTTHGMKGTPVYRTWTSMNNRCTNINDEHYKYYGERGITVCKRWKNSFVLFLEDMGDRPKGKTIERINNDLGYFKENCC